MHQAFPASVIVKSLALFCCVCDMNENKTCFSPKLFPEHVFEKHVFCLSSDIALKQKQKQETKNMFFSLEHALNPRTCFCVLSNERPSWPWLLSRD